MAATEPAPPQRRCPRVLARERRTRRPRRHRRARRGARRDRRRRRCRSRSTAASRASTCSTRCATPPARPSAATGLRTAQVLFIARQGDPAAARGARPGARRAAIAYVLLFLHRAAADRGATTPRVARLLAMVGGVAPAPSARCAADRGHDRRERLRDLLGPQHRGGARRAARRRWSSPAAASAFFGGARAGRRVRADRDRRDARRSADALRRRPRRDRRRPARPRPGRRARRPSSSRRSGC